MSVESRPFVEQPKEELNIFQESKTMIDSVVSGRGILPEENYAKFLRKELVSKRENGQVKEYTKDVGYLIFERDAKTGERRINISLPLDEGVQYARITEGASEAQLEWSYHNRVPKPETYVNNKQAKEAIENMLSHFIPQPQS